MALIPEEDINKVIEANDIVAVVSEAVPGLKQRGGRFLACCPFHKEKTPSFQVDPNLGLWHCFGCGEGGNIITFVEKFYDMTFVEAMEFLADKVNIQLKKSSSRPGVSKSQKARLSDACNLAADFYHQQLMRVKSAAANSARKYLGQRNMGSDVSKRWMLGFAPGNNELTKYLMSKKFSAKELIAANLCVSGRDGRARDRFYNRVMFPIFDNNSNVIAFGGRIIGDGQPKYLNSSENVLFHKSNVLYGLDKAKANMAASGTAIVVEGYTDVIAMHETGINYTVATLGTALTKQHIRLLNQHAKKRIIYLFDGDEAGQRAAERALNFIDQMELPEVYNKRAQLLALTLPDNMDPKEFIDENGKDQLIDLLNNAKPLLQYGIERKISQYDLNMPGNKARAATCAIKILAPIKDSLIAKEYAAMISDLTGMRTEDLIAELTKLKKPSNYDDSLNYDTQQTTIKNNIKMNTKREKFELELLCVFAKHPKDLKSLIFNDITYRWTNNTHKNLFQYIKQSLSENPNIDVQELILKVHQKNPQSANMLTKISNMYDIIDEPIKHAEFLISTLKVEDLKEEIKQKKTKFSNMVDGKEKDLLYEEIMNLQTEQNKFKLKIKDMI